MSAKPNEWIVKSATVVMQSCDELGGIEDPDEYIATMHAIAAEATRRADACEASRSVAKI